MPERFNVVVTGASGFLGRAVVSRLLTEGYNCIAVTRGDVVIPGVTMLRVTEYSQLVAPPGAVLIHLAENRSIELVEGVGNAYHEAATKLVHTLLSQPWSHVIYISSVAVYGDRSSKPRMPNEHLFPLSSYGRCKLACESLVLAEGGTVFRATNLIGPGMATQNVLADILRQLGGVGPLTLRALKPIRDYLWVEDAAALIVQAVRLQKNGVFNAASGRGVSVLELATLALDAAGEIGRAIVETRPVSDNYITKLDIELTTHTFDWLPKTSLEAALKILLYLKTYT